MFVTDTNILVQAAIREASHHGQARAAMARWQAGDRQWFATWPIVYEFLRVVTHPAVYRRPLSFADGWSFVEALLAQPGFGILTETERHPAVVAEMQRDYPWAAGSIMHDLHTVALMREHGVAEIRTADTGFHRFRGLRVVNPLVG